MATVLFILQQLTEALIGVLSAAGNALVLYVIHKHQSLRTVTNYLIGSLALADLLVGIVGIPCVIINNFNLPHDFYGCLIMNSIIVVLTQISIFSLVAVAIERFVAIRFPIFHRQKLTAVRAAFVIVVLWVAGIVVGFVPVFGWNNGPSVDNACIFMEIIDMEYMVYFNFFGFVLVPLLVIFLTYGYIFYVVHKKSKSVAHLSETAHRARMKKESQAAKRIFIVILLFAACWLPVHIMNTVTLFHNKSNGDLIVTAVLLSHLNSAMNPFLYAYGNIKFRVAFRKTLRMNYKTATAAGPSTV